VDIGRRKHATEIVAVELRGGLYILHWRDKMARVSFEEQGDTLRALLGREDVRLVSIDETGIGMNLAEDLAREFGGRVRPESFSPKKKERWATYVRQVFESGRIRIPEDRDLMNQIRSIRRVATEGPYFRYDVAAGEKGHHADAFWALALALDAGREEGYEPTETEFVGGAAGEYGDAFTSYAEDLLGINDDAPGVWGG
jgi:phage FluMu gp28-like protein